MKKPIKCAVLVYQAGIAVRSACCNKVGDIVSQQWSEDLPAAPFSDKFRPVNEN